MTKLHYPLFNEAAPISDAGGGFPADDFAAALEAGMSEAAQPQAQAPKESQPSEELGTKVKGAEAETPTAKTKLTDKIGKIEEEKVEEVATDTEELPEGDQSPKAVSKWKQLRQTEKQFKELEPKLKEYEAKIAELQKAVIPPELEAELAELRQHRDVFDLHNSPEFKKTVAEPLERIGAEVADIANEFKLNEGELLNAMRETTEWKRTIAIEKAIKSAEKKAQEAAEESGEEYNPIPSGVIGVIANHANRLHQVWQKQSELETKAGELQQFEEAKYQQKSQLATVEQEKAWTKAADESRTIIETNFGPIIKAMPEAERTNFFDALKNARIADDLPTKAFQAMSVEALAVVTNAYNAVRKELAAEKKLNSGLISSKPGTKQNHGEPVKKVAPGSDYDDFESELESAMKNQFA